MHGFQPLAQRGLAHHATNPQHLADGGSVGFGARGLAGLRDLIPKMAAMGYPQPTPAPAPAVAAAPATDPRAAQLQAMIPRVEAMGYQQRPQMLARGGVVRGPGTGTSDSIETEAEPGTFIMPADSTEAIGPSALEQMGTVPVRLSDGEFKVPPEQVMALGAAVLKLLKDATHAPVNGKDGGQTDAEVAEARGFAPGAAERMAQAPEQLYADGGTVDPLQRPTSFGDAAAVASDPSTTQVRTSSADTFGTAAPAPAPAAPQPALGSNLAAATRMTSFSDPRSTMYDPNPYAASNADKLAASGQSSRATVEAGMPPAPAPVTAGNSFGDASAATRDASVTQVASGFQPGRGTVSTVPAQPVAQTAAVSAAQRMASAPAPAAPAGWTDRNAQRNAEVSAASITNRPEWSKTPRAPGAAPPAEPPPPAPPPVDSRINMPASTFQSRAGYGFQPRRYADGGMVEDDLQKRLAQIPVGGLQAPAADGSQSNPLNNEIGRNAINTLSALPGAGGLASRGGATAARAATGGAVSAERVIPAAWEVVQDGGTLASRTGSAAQQMGQIGNTSGGALSRAAGMVSPQAAPALAAPGGQVARAGGQAAQEVAGFTPGAAARGATEFAERVPDAALAMSNTAQAAAPAGTAAARGFGRYAATGAAGLAGAAALTGATNDSTAAQAQTSGGAQSVPPAVGAPGSTPAPAATQSQPTGAPAGFITRDGNSYTGPANLAGDVQIRNADGSVRNGGVISAQNMAAADALGARQARESAARVMAQMPAGFPAAAQAPTVLTSENSWQKRNDLRNALVSASSITNDGGKWDRHKGESPESLTYRAMLGTDQALQGSAPVLAQAAMREQGDTQRAGLQVAAQAMQGAANRENDLNRTLITERGNNSRAAIAANAALGAAKAKADAAGGKPLAGPVLKQLQEARDNAVTIGNLNDTFKNDFASKGIMGVGADLSLMGKSVAGVDKDAVDWWKNYRKQAELTERHALFGASLTPGEQDSWRSADIGPGMHPDVIKKNLATRSALASKMFGNTRQDLIDAGHSEERINAIANREAGAAASTAAMPSAVPDGAVAHLRGNPSLAAQFDAKYGAGASARYLQK